MLEMVRLLASTLWTSLLRMVAMERMRCCVRGSIRRSVFRDDSNSFNPFPETRRDATRTAAGGQESDGIRVLQGPTVTPEPSVCCAQV